jgi:hypothetical protein
MKKPTRKEQAQQTKWEADYERLGKLLEKHGFVNAMRMVVEKVCAPDSSYMRREMVYQLQSVERSVQRMAGQAEDWRQLDEMLGERLPEDGTTLGKLDAFARDTRGNVNERANAQAMADKIRERRT